MNNVNNIIWKIKKLYVPFTILILINLIIREKKFYIRDKFVDAYHAVSKKTKSSLIELTDKKFTIYLFG